ncbi:hypothetical protein PLICRDRAFT_694470 [Plicaturopsis crispa FD-325 SS-3]|nr:hypothetical protein PLICRDRAFT_694470 [Plicaturopsis crispa FD-325 SS-3]
MSRPNRQALEALKRADLQKLCKDYGVKANLKTEALIDLVLDASQPRPPRSQSQVQVHPPPSQPSTTMRRVSSRVGTRSRDLSRSSVIIHDTDDEEEEEEEEPEPAPPAPEPIPVAPRTRKAKETQTRLGVGRPVAAGGSGARAVTKSVSVSRGSRRGKGSRSVKPVEETIVEEEPEQAAETIAEEMEVDEPIAGPSGTSQHEQETEHTAQPLAASPPNASLASLESIDKHVAEALRPLHEHMQSLRGEVERLKTQMSEMDNLKARVETLTIEIEGLRHEAGLTKQLEAEVKELKGKIATMSSRHSAMTSTPRVSTPVHFQGQMKGMGSGTNALAGPSTSKAASRPTNDSHYANLSGSQTVHGQSAASYPANHPGIAPIMLGKRHRDSTESEVTGVFDAGDEEQMSPTEVEKQVPRPVKKRAKLDPNTDDSFLSDGESPLDSEDLHELHAPSPQPRGPGFQIYSGPTPSSPLDEEPASYVDPPPPINHLPDFFGPPSPPSPNHFGPTTSTAHASENQNPFNFSFMPMTTPLHTQYPTPMPSFPFPEPPQSPSPAGPSRHHAFSPERPHSRASGSGQAPRSSSGSGFGVDPALLFQTAASEVAAGKDKKERKVTSNEVAAGMGLHVLKAGEPGVDSDAAPMKRTMYGTELEGDTRFGDFGVEGVATGFWAGGRF